MHSYLTLEELRRYFSRRYDRETASDEMYYLISLPNLRIIPRDKAKQKISRHIRILLDNDLPHLVSVIISDADYFVMYNRHFIDSKARDYIKVTTQADFVKLLGIKPKQTRY